jgi:hypothetical protein
VVRPARSQDPKLSVLSGIKHLSEEKQMTTGCMTVRDFLGMESFVFDPTPVFFVV